MNKQSKTTNGEAPRRLKIGFVFDDSLDKVDGVAQYVKNLGKWLSRRGHSVSYLVGETKIKQWEGGSVHSLSKNMSVIFNGNRLSMPVLPDRSGIKRLLNTEKFDVLHVQVPYSPFMAQQVINRASKNTAVIGTVHVMAAGKLSSLGSKALKPLYGKSLKRFDKMISVSPVAASYAKSSFGLQSLVSSNVVELEKFSAKKSNLNRQTKPRIVFLGRLVKRKGCLELLEAFCSLREEVPGAKLIIAGDGPLRRQLEDRVKSKNLEDSVKFLGFIDEQSKPELLSQATIACFPALYGESFGIVLIEAMAAGAGVVIGGDNPGYRSVLGGQPDTLFNPKDTQQFSELLKKMLEDDKVRQKLHDWQSQHVKEYDVEVVGPKLERIYLEEVDKRATSGHN